MPVQHRRLLSLDELETTAQNTNWHRRDIRNGKSALCPIGPRSMSYLRPGSAVGTYEASTQKIGESTVLNRADKLATINAQRCQHLNELKGTEVVDMLHWIFELQ